MQVSGELTYIYVNQFSFPFLQTCTGDKKIKPRTPMCSDQTGDQLCTTRLNVAQCTTRLNVAQCTTRLNVAQCTTRLNVAQWFGMERGIMEKIVFFTPNVNRTADIESKARKQAKVQEGAFKGKLHPKTISSDQIFFSLNPMAKVRGRNSNRKTVIQKAK